MAIGREYRNVLAQTPGLQELATKVGLMLLFDVTRCVQKELTFEDFKKQSVTYVLPKPVGVEPGMFQ